MLGQIRDDLRKQKELAAQQEQQEVNQVFDYIDMDDGFDNVDVIGVGSSAL